MNRRRRQAIVQTAAMLFAVQGVDAQTKTATIEGFARIAGTNAPMPFSLVRLLRNDSTAIRSETITNAEGRFRFVHIAPGDVQLQILRIGFHPSTSPLLHVAADESLRHDLVSEPLPIRLPAVAIHAASGCLGATHLADDSTLASLWNEAGKGVEIRRAFELRYRFSRSLRQVAAVHWRLRPDRHQIRVDTINSEPDSIHARESRARLEHASAGYGKDNRLIVPDEKELLDESFLRDHCLEALIQRANGMFGVSFRPSGREQVGYAIRGTIWLDSATYGIRRIDYEHLDGGDVFSRVTVDYAPVRVNESSLYLPFAGNAMLRPRGPGHWLASAVTATLSYSYWGFEEAPPR